MQDYKHSCFVTIFPLLLEWKKKKFFFLQVVREFYKTLGDLIGSIAVTACSAYHHRSSGSSRHGMWSFSSAHRWKIPLEEEVEGNCHSVLSRRVKGKAVSRLLRSTITFYWVNCLVTSSNTNPSKLPLSPQDLVKTPEHGLEKPLSLSVSLSPISLHPHPTFLLSGHMELLQKFSGSNTYKLPFLLSCFLGSPSLAPENSPIHSSALSWSPISSEKQPHTLLQLRDCPSLTQAFMTQCHLCCDMHTRICTRTTLYICFLFGSVRAGLLLMFQWSISIQLSVR